MKKVILLFFSFLIIFSCNQKVEEINDTDKLYSIYEENLETAKKLNKAMLEYDKKVLEQYLSEDFEYYNYPVNKIKGVKYNKERFIELIMSQEALGADIEIKNSIFLPGLDTVDLQIDGSVRVYFGSTYSLHDQQIEKSSYQTIEFNKGKISRIDDFSDLTDRLIVNTIFCDSDDCINGKNDTLTIRSSDGNVMSKYIGGFKYGLAHGQGTLLTRNGDVFTGIWEDGQLIEQTSE